MNPLSKWKVTAYLAAIFCAGLVSGWMASTAIARRSALKPPQPREMISTFVERVRRFNLNPQQERQVDGIAARSAAEMSAINEENFRRMRQCMSNRHAQVCAILTPEQREGFEKAEKERQRRFGQRGPGHGPPHGPGDHFRPPPPGPRPGEDRPPSPPPA